MSAFFFRDFIGEYVQHVQAAEDWVDALKKLIVGGFSQGLENRLPLTWSDRDAIISRITRWTVSPEAPQGSARTHGGSHSGFLDDRLGLTGNAVAQLASRCAPNCLNDRS